MSDISTSCDTFLTPGFMGFVIKCNLAAEIEALFGSKVKKTQSKEKREGKY